MKAVVCEKYGPPDVLAIRDCPKPEPKRSELLVKVKATSVTAADYRIRGLNVPTGFRFLMRIGLGFSRLRQPVLGIDFSGVVEAVGEGVGTFQVGDEVMGTSGLKFGCYAEYLCISEKAAVVRKPSSVGFEEAAVFPFGALAALSFLRDLAKLQAGQTVLVYGASGAVGTASVRLAKELGAEVTGVCSGGNVEMVRSLGADRVVDYQRQDFSELGEAFDVTFDTVGKAGIEKLVGATKKGGIALFAVAGIPENLRIRRLALTSGKKLRAGVAGEKKADLEFLVSKLATGKLEPVMDRSYRLDDIVEAHRYAESGRKRGNVAIRVS